MSGTLTDMLTISLPKGWASPQLRRLASITNGGTPKGDPEHWGGDLPFVTPPDLRRWLGRMVETTERTLTEVGAVNGSTQASRGVIISNRAPIGYVARLSGKVAFNQGCKVVCSQSMDEQFLMYVLLAAGPVLQELGQGTTFMEISATALGSLRIPSPSDTEQRHIVDFLDRETAQIDSVIEKQETLVQGLQTRQAASIAGHLDVTSLVSPGAKFKHHVATARQGWSPQCNSWPAAEDSWAVLRTGCTNGGTFDPHDNKELPDDETPRPETVVGDSELIVSRANTRELVGSAAVVHGSFPMLMLSDKHYSFRFRSTLNPDFAALALRTRPYRDLIELDATGASSSMQNITRDTFLNLPMNAPDRAVQDRLVDVANSELCSGEHLIAKAKRFIELARERRAVLITAAVTGQLDVTSKEAA